MSSLIYFFSDTNTPLPRAWQCRALKWGPDDCLMPFRMGNACDVVISSVLIVVMKKNTSLGCQVLPDWYLCASPKELFPGMELLVLWWSTEVSWDHPCRSLPGLHGNLLGQKRSRYSVQRGTSSLQLLCGSAAVMNLGHSLWGWGLKEGDSPWNWLHH